MRWSQTHIYTLKEAPSDAEIISHKLLVRGGYIKKVAPGIFTYQNLGLRTIRKIEGIIREELDRRGCTEVLMPMVQPRELWEETNRWTDMGAGLLKFKNRNEQDFCLGATHEEVVTDLVRHDLRSYRDLPKIIYQIQTKYRDEIRPRFGLMRGREFIMKDAYSFDQDVTTALKTYQLMYEAYQSIFKRMGVDYRIVEADAGQIGGSQTHEFQVLAQSGEDHLMVCERCEFAANIEIAPAGINPEDQHSQGPLLEVERFSTPGLRTIDDLAQALKVSGRDLMKTLFFEGSKGQPIVVLLRGSDEVNPIKLKNLLGLANPPALLSDAQVKSLTGAMPGSCGPVGLKCDIYVDISASTMRNFVVGANQDDFHLRHVNFDRDFQVTQNVDLRMARSGDNCTKCNIGKYRSLRGIEVGHVFYLGTKYSKSMQATFLNTEGKSSLIEMGCYGIGVSRSLQASVEQNHDDDGIIWPVALAPYELHIVLLDPKESQAVDCVEELEKSLAPHGVSVFIDDRDERPGVKFKDADLLGFPLRLNVGKRGLEAQTLELVHRKTKVTEKIVIGPPGQTERFDGIVQRICGLLKNNLADF